MCIWKDRSILPNSQTSIISNIFVVFLFSDDTLFLGKGTNSLLAILFKLFSSLAEQTRSNLKHKKLDDFIGKKRSKSIFH